MADMALTPITITFGNGPAPVLNPDGSLASGGITFVLMVASAPASIEDSVSGETVLPTPIAAAVYQGQLLAHPSGGAGYAPLTLIANDDTRVAPTGSYYLVTEELAAGSKPAWQFIVHAASVGGVQSLVSQRPT